MRKSFPSLALRIFTFKYLALGASLLDVNIYVRCAQGSCDLAVQGEPLYVLMC